MKSSIWTFFDEAHEVAGWLGTLFILTAYFLLSFQVIEAQSLPYQGLNILGALGLIYNGFQRKAYPSVVLNLIWISIGVVALLSLFRN